MKHTWNGTFYFYCSAHVCTGTKPSCHEKKYSLVSALYIQKAEKSHVVTPISELGPESATE